MIADIADADRLPNGLRILLENLRRHASSEWVRPEHEQAVLHWRPDAAEQPEIPFFPSRILLQDYTAVPAFVDLAAMRDVVRAAGRDPGQINPLLPVQVVVDHSLVADVFGRPDAADRNADLEYRRNGERYRFLRWVQRAFQDTVVIPPGAGIVHQVNLEQLAEVVSSRAGWVFPDTVLGADSHTTMVNGLGVLGWGIGGIEAEAVMLGEPVLLRLPRVIGVELVGALPEGSTATDLVLALTARLRGLDTVGAFVEFYGTGVATLPVADRATIANMSPEFGSTCALFPIDRQTLDYLMWTGRGAEQVALVEWYARQQGLWADPGRAFDCTERLRIDLANVRPCVAGPSRPQDRIDLDRVPATLRETIHMRQSTQDIKDGSVVLAAITSCTNTANPALMLAAGLVARNAVRRGLRSKPWVKTTLAPGSTVVMDYLNRAGLTADLATLGFHLIGFGCTTCIGNSGPLADGVAATVSGNEIAVAAVLSGNRNFEGRVHPNVRLSFLASPPLVVAYALAGTVDLDLTRDPLAVDDTGAPVHLRDLWPSTVEVAEAAARSLAPADFVAARDRARVGDQRWQALPDGDGAVFAWDPASTYVRRSPFAAAASTPAGPVADIVDARVLAVLGDMVTTDHITPSGEIAPDSPAGRELARHRVAPEDFNSYGSRRGNHEVAARATFANRRVRNQLVDRCGGYSRDHLTGETVDMYEAAQRYRDRGVPLVILAGRAYGSGSSRDWAAKGTMLLGVRAVIAESFERIHRANLLGMGVLPLQFAPGQSTASLALTGRETVTISGLTGCTDTAWPATVRVQAGDCSFVVTVRIETTQEAAWYAHGGIIPYVLRRRWLGHTPAPDPDRPLPP